MSNLLALRRHSNFFPLGIDVVVMEALRVKCNTALFAPVALPLQCWHTPLTMGSLRMMRWPMLSNLMTPWPALDSLAVVEISLPFPCFTNISSTTCLVNSRRDMSDNFFSSALLHFFSRALSFMLMLILSPLLR